MNKLELVTSQLLSHLARIKTVQQFEQRGQTRFGQAVLVILENWIEMAMELLVNKK